MPGAIPQVVTLKTAPPAAASAAGAGDIDLYVLGIPVAGSPLDIRGSARTKGSSESLTVVLDPGEYYAVVTDFAGRPINYSLCAAVGTSCTLPAGFQVSLTPSMSRNAGPRRP